MMMTVVFGQMRLCPPAMGPLINDIGNPNIDIRLGYEPGMGEPLFVGVVPRPEDPSAPKAWWKAIYTLWPKPRDTIANSCAALFNVNVNSAGSPTGEWLVFLVHGQPPGFGPGIEGGVGILFGEFQTITDAAGRWFKAHGIDAPSNALIADLVARVHAAEAEADKDTRGAALWPASSVLRPAPNTLKQDPSQVRFVVTCCQYPPGILDHAPLVTNATPGPSEQALDKLTAWRQANPTGLDFILMLGDQVYVDATAGLSDPALADDRYVNPYLHWLTRPAVRQALSGLPLHALPDDHEFVDIWGPVSPSACGQTANGTAVCDVYQRNRQIKSQGLDSYWAFQGHVPAINNPGPRPIPDHVYRLVGPTGQVFLADTRTERECRNAHNIDTARIMSRTQWYALHQWLTTRAPTAETPLPPPCFLACASLVLPMHHVARGATPASALRSDSWGGYPHSLCELLATICDLELNHLILLSGDEHLACISQITLRCLDLPDAQPVVVHSLHAPPIYAPYPFANAKRSDFSLAGFDFKSPTTGRHYHCDVDAWFPAYADGFLVVEAPAQGAAEQRVQVTLSFAKTTLDPQPAPTWLTSSTRLCVKLTHDGTPE